MQNNGEKNKIIMHDKCNIWQPSFTHITKIKTIKEQTKTNIMKPERSFKKTNERVELKERNEKLWKDSSLSNGLFKMVWC
jgi:hypothetical protein